MAQIIDIEERRKPRSLPGVRGLPAAEPALLDPLAYMDSFYQPLTQIWRTWVVAWGSLWLAPLGLQVSSLEPPQAAPKDRLGPRR